MNHEIDIELPEGAKQGLKDASQDIYLKTSMMNEKLKNSLPLNSAKKGDNEKALKSKDPATEMQQKSNKKAKKQDKSPNAPNNTKLLNKEKDLPSPAKMETPKLDQNSNNHSQTTSMLDMHNKLKEVVSPSSSKPEDEDDYYME